MADESDSGHDMNAPSDAHAQAAAPEQPRKDKEAEAVHAAPSEDGSGDLGAQIALWEKVVKVNKRLEQQEERLVRLYVGFRRSDPGGAAVDDRDQLRASLARLEQVQLHDHHQGGYSLPLAELYTGPPRRAHRHPCRLLVFSRTSRTAGGAWRPTPIC